MSLFFPHYRKKSFLNQTLGLKRSFLNQTTYVLKNQLEQPSLGLKLSDAGLPIVIGLSLGATLCQLTNVSAARMWSQMAFSVLTVISKLTVFPRHTEGNILIKRAYSQLDIPSILERNHLIDSEDQRPNGVTAFAVKQGKCVTWDYTCENTLSDSYLFQNNKKSWPSCNQRRKDKDRHI